MLEWTTAGDEEKLTIGAHESTSEIIGLRRTKVERHPSDEARFVFGEGGEGRHDYTSLTGFNFNQARVNGEYAEFWVLF